MIRSNQTSKRPTPQEHRLGLLEKLYRNALDGKGTDLQVIVPASAVESDEDTAENASQAKTKTFHLHHTIVAATSNYFATFPTPKRRTINDFDSVSFSLCVKFMYLGNCDFERYKVNYWERLSHDNVASVLHCADILQIDTLIDECIGYLEDNLDHSNYEVVVELADKYNKQELKKSALRFRTEGLARDELISRRKSLFAQIATAAQNQEEASKRKEMLEKKLRATELQLKEWYTKEHETVMSSQWMQKFATRAEEQDEIPNVMGNLKMPGSVGHIVQTSRRYAYEGSTMYTSEIDSNGEDDSDTGSDGYDYEPGEGDPKPTPAPTREQYEKFGIIHSHCSILDAIEVAKPGDRIYLSPGTHKLEEEMYGQAREKIFIEKELEIIGLGDADEVIVTVDYWDNNGFEVMGGQGGGFYNITFRTKFDRCDRDEIIEDRRTQENPSYAYGSAEHAIITFEEVTEYRRPLKANYFVKNCIFEMGTDIDSAFPARLSGIFLKRGKSATIEDCQFLGGSGSAIVAVNDPYLHTPKVEINRNMFFNNGQPAICEQTPKSGEVTQGPASVEFFKFDRKLHKIHSLGSSREVEKTVNVNMVNNNFTSNLRAPIACRVITPTPETSCFNSSTARKENSYEVRSGIPDGSATTLHGFSVMLNDNVIKGNGLALEIIADTRVANTLSPQRKKTKLPKKDDTTENPLYPDGNSILVIHHNLSRLDEHTFPEYWGQGDPCDGFWDNYSLGDTVSRSDEDEDSYYGYRGEDYY